MTPGGTVRPLPAAVRAFDALAPGFDAAFAGWRSVAAQRRAVRRELLAAFSSGSRLLELGGGTGEDALFLAGEGRRVHVTDGAPAMVERTRAKARAAGLDDRVTAEAVTLEGLDAWAAARTTPPSRGGSRASSRRGRASFSSSSARSRPPTSPS
jgi:hypothetical protein